MTTWHDCPGKDSEQYPGKPGHVVSPDALAACNRCCQDDQDHGAVHADDHDHGADDHADRIYIDGAFLILIILLVQFYMCIMYVLQRRDDPPVRQSERDFWSTPCLVRTSSCSALTCVVTSALQGQSLLTTGISKLRHAQQASARRSSGGKLTHPTM